MEQVSERQTFQCRTSLKKVDFLKPLPQARGQRRSQSVQIQEEELVVAIQLLHERVSERLSELDYGRERVVEHIVRARTSRC